MMTATRLLHVQARLGEGAIWDHRAQALWWVDIIGHALHRYDPSGQRDEMWAMPSAIGTVVPRASGGVVVALQNDLAAFDPVTRTLTTLAGIDHPELRFNDGKCDPAGRLWVGTLAWTEAVGAGALYRLDPQVGLNVQVPHITIANGIVWSRDGRTCWYIDTPTKRVDAFDFDLVNGRLSNRRPAVMFPDGVGFPDGMAIDEHDNLWVAMWGGGCVLCCDPRSGRIVDRIDVPGASKITSCAFGGPALDTLYITSAGGGTAEPDLSVPMQAARKLGVELVRLDGLILPDGLLRMVPGKIANSYRVFPIRLHGDELVLAMSDPDAMSAAADLAHLLRVRQVSFALVLEADLDAALHRHYPEAGTKPWVQPESSAGDLFVAHPRVRGVPSTPYAG